MDQKRLSELISRYKAGTATPEEIALLDKLWSGGDNESNLANDHTPEELRVIEQSMFLAINDSVRKSQSRATRRLVSPVLYRVAATILIVMAVSIWWYSGSDSLNEIRTGFGEHRTVVLPDQSTVVLNGNSVLKFASQ